ncbi:MAG: ATP-binding protein [Candidatus Poribacteria bacterium]|nr:ATP-binding protein [Candidatus Poribacteria bacterium]
MKIKREKLLNDLRDFAARGNGVIIGSPGVGKTYLLKELYLSLESLEIPVFILPVDQLGDGTDKTLREELSYEGDLIERLKSVPISDQKAILLFDAFDAARDEQTRKNFLRLIRSAIQELKGIWNVVVTVRTYDAKKSQELLDLFGSPDDTKYQNEGVLCRYFTIPSFNEVEILEAFDQIRCPKAIYYDGTQDFKDLLANPFNLWLLEKVLKSSQDIPDFSQIHSEVQLLDLFWRRRVKNEISERVLRRISNPMVEKCSLTVKVDDIYDDVDLDNPVRKTAWDKLQSDEILTKVSLNGQRIAFSHNILFDYAISVLLIDEEPQHLEDFVLEDPSRPLFLRPSLTYFFTRLWYYDSESFWKAFWHLFPSDQSVHLRLVARLIPTSVVANEAREIEDLSPILEKFQNGEEIANEAVTRLFQALRTLPIERDVFWSEFFDHVSEYLHASFAWELATHTWDILEQAIKYKNTEIIKTCGRIGRRLLTWVWRERETNENDWYNRFGGRWAVTLVAKTYHTNVEESRALLEKVLHLTKEENFPISFLSWLTEHVNSIWTHDPELVVSIYRTVFAYYELSGVKTSFGSSSVMPMISTRRQDYRMCQYRLVKHFPKFLKAAPSHATQAVIQSLNFFIVTEHIARYLKDSVTLNDMVETFNFRGKPAYFMEDGSYIWDARNSSDEPIKMADALFEYIGELARSEDSRLDSLLCIFRDEVVVAFFWKRLLKAASQFPKVFAQHLFELCIAEPIQRYPETYYELGLFLEAASSEFTQEQLCQIEERILAHPIETADDEHNDLLERQRNRLLAQIPVNLLTTNEGKKIREKMAHENDVPHNRPLVSVEPPTWSAYTEEEDFQRQGVDTSKPQNQELRRFSGPLTKFSSDWQNGVPTPAAARLILPRLQEAYTAIKSDIGADKKVIDSLWHKLSACVSLLGRIANSLESDAFAFCREVLLAAAKHEQPKFNPEYDTQFDFPGYSPCPRHEAASGLLRLALHQSDAEILDAIEMLANDLVPSVRMVTAMELFKVSVKTPEGFWRIMNNRARHEQNRVVQKYLYHTLNWVAARENENEDRTTRVMAKLLAHTPPPTEGLEPSDPFIALLVGLTIVRQNGWTSKTIEDTFFKDPIRFANPLARLVTQIMDDYVIPRNLETPDGQEVIERGILWVSRAIAVAADALKKLGPALFKNPNDEEVKGKLQDTYGVIDAVITRLYFTVAYERNKGEESKNKIPYELRCRFYNKIKPLMEQVIDCAQEKESGMMFAPTAHYFMQLLTSFLSCNPKEVLHLAAGVVRSSERFGYNLDSIAVRDVVEFVEIVLADHRDKVRDGEALEDLLNLLDMFAKTGWTDALKLIWRLDEVFR